MSRGIPPLEERRAFTHPVTLAQYIPRLAEHPSEAAV